jgi:predicted amidophosphoribosyltransferase
MLYDFKDKTVLLIDDIYTTGNTVNECSRVLKNSGAKKIIVATVAIA